MATEKQIAANRGNAKHSTAQNKIGAPRIQPQRITAWSGLPTER